MVLVSNGNNPLHYLLTRSQPETFFNRKKKKTKPKYLIKQNATLDVISYCVNTYGIEKQNLGSHRY